MSHSPDTLFFDRLDKEWEAAMAAQKRYDVLDFNNDVLESFDSLPLASAYLAQWETAESKGAIRDNEYYDDGGWEIIRDNRDLSGEVDF